MKENSLTPENNMQVTERLFKEIGERIVRLRLELGYTQRQLSITAGIGRSTLVRIEQGQSTSVEAYMMIAKQLEVSLDYMLWGRNEPDLESKITELIDQLFFLRNQIPQMDNGCKKRKGNGDGI